MEIANDGGTIASASITHNSWFDIDWQTVENKVYQLQMCIAATKEQDKVHLITYADDFVITGATKEILEQAVKPLAIQFLKERNLELSDENTFLGG